MPWTIGCRGLGAVQRVSPFRLQRTGPWTCGHSDCTRTSLTRGRQCTFEDFKFPRPLAQKMSTGQMAISLHTIVIACTQIGSCWRNNSTPDRPRVSMGLGLSLRCIRMCCRAVSARDSSLVRHNSSRVVFEGRRKDGVTGFGLGPNTPRQLWSGRTWSYEGFRGPRLVPRGAGLLRLLDNKTWLRSASPMPPVRCFPGLETGGTIEFTNSFVGIPDWGRRRIRHGRAYLTCSETGVPRSISFETNGTQCRSSTSDSA